MGEKKPFCKSNHTIEFHRKMARVYLSEFLHSDCCSDKEICDKMHDKYLEHKAKEKELKNKK